jgi:hypothetical protein
MDADYALLFGNGIRESAPDDRQNKTEVPPIKVNKAFLPCHFEWRDDYVLDGEILPHFSTWKNLKADQDADAEEVDFDTFQASTETFEDASPAKKPRNKEGNPTPCAPNKTLLAALDDRNA